MAIALGQEIGAFPSIVAAAAGNDDSSGTHSRAGAPHVVAGLSPGLDTFATLANCF